MSQAAKQNATKAVASNEWETKYLETHRVETFKSTISLSTEIFKYLTLLNGGAVAGMLTTLDRLTKILSVSSIRISIGLFLFGLALNGLGVFALYFSQTVAYKADVVKPDRTRQKDLLVWAAWFQIMSLFFFCIGALIAVMGL